jgi:hypothetical protein
MRINRIRQRVKQLKKANDTWKQRARVGPEKKKNPPPPMDREQVKKIRI